MSNTLNLELLLDELNNYFTKVSWRCENYKMSTSYLSKIFSTVAPGDFFKLSEFLDRTLDKILAL